MFVEIIGVDLLALATSYLFIRKLYFCQLLQPFSFGGLKDFFARWACLSIILFLPTFYAVFAKNFCTFTTRGGMNKYSLAYFTN